MNAQMVYRDKFWWVITVDYHGKFLSVVAKFRHARQAREEFHRLWALFH
jgi:hypothetical protein